MLCLISDSNFASKGKTCLFARTHWLDFKVNAQGVLWVEVMTGLWNFHIIARGDGRSTTLGKVFVDARTTIRFSWLIYPRMKFRYIILATKHSASSSDTSMPDIASALWNIAIGIRVPFPVATHLYALCQRVKQEI